MTLQITLWFEGVSAFQNSQKNRLWICQTLSQLLLKHAYLAQTDYLVIPSPVLLAVTVVVALIASMAESLSLSHFEYFTVTGYFLQDDPATDPEDFDYVCSLSTLEQNAERRGPSTNQNVVIKRIRPHKPKVRYR